MRSERGFRPSERLDEPRTFLTVNAAVAPTQEEADRLAKRLDGYSDCDVAAEWLEAADGGVLRQPPGQDLRPVGAHGNGGNGKGVFLETIAGVLGDYATIQPAGFLMASKFQQHATELAEQGCV